MNVFDSVCQLRSGWILIFGLMPTHALSMRLLLLLLLGPYMALWYGSIMQCKDIFFDFEFIYIVCIVFVCNWFHFSRRSCWFSSARSYSAQKERLAEPKIKTPSSFLSLLALLEASWCAKVISIHWRWVSGTGTSKCLGLALRVRMACQKLLSWEKWARADIFWRPESMYSHSSRFFKHLFLWAFLTGCCLLTAHFA